MASKENCRVEEKGEDIVHAFWRQKDKHEQGMRSGSCAWITSFLGRPHFTVTRERVRLLVYLTMTADNLEVAYHVAYHFDGKNDDT